jgi:filamentous hemagglutinin family protein
VKVFAVVGSTHRADGGQAKRRSRRGYRTLLLLSTALVPVSASANPTGASVVAGAATITRGGSTLTVNQASNRAIVNWQSFSIGAGETTQIRQPSSTSAILNRVTGANPSALLGHLTSNGQVYLINPNGIVVGPNGRINTAAFVASTLNVPDAAFMAGGAMTFAGDSGAGIRVLGSIQATTGDVVLIAVAVDNEGRITAPNGQAILAAGGQVLYVPDGQSDIVIKASSSAPAAVSNSGTIAAAAVQLKAAGSAYALAVNDSGTVSATAIHQIGGRVVLDGGDGDTRVSGAISAQAGDTGGAVTVTGKHVTLGGSAVVDVSAPTGGGRVAIGGGKHGADSKIANADTTDIQQGAQIKANATTKGNGGAVTVWSDHATRFAGTIEAKGGPDGGDGGDVEVSGRALVFHGTANTQAPHGKQGRLLLDPATMDIDAAAASAIETTLQTSDVTVAASNSVTVDAGITSAATGLLDLQAPTIAVNADISLLNGALEFDSNAEPGVSVSSLASAAITALNLDVLGSFPMIDLEGPVVASTFSLSGFGIQTSLTATNAANSIGALSFGIPSAPVITLTDSAAVTSSTAMKVSGGLSADGDITFVSAGDLTMEASTFLAAGGTATLASTGGVFVNEAGTTLLGGNGRALIYTANTNGAFTDGGLAFPQFQSVSYPNDPQSGLQNVTYVAGTPSLPVLTITADDIARLYGAADPAFTASFDGGTDADLTSPVQFRLLQTNDLNVGAYTIVPFGATSSIDQLVYVNGTLTVNPAPLTITANNASRFANTGNPTFSASFLGLENGDTPNLFELFFPASATPSSPAGTYPITLFGNGIGVAGLNYEISFVSGTLTVAPQPIVHTATVTVSNIPDPAPPIDQNTTTTTLLNTNFDAKTGPVTVDQGKFATCSGGCVGFGNGPEEAEFDNVIDALASALAGKTPPVTSDSIRAALADPKQNATVMGALLPYMYTDLSNILATPQSQWTAQQAAFVVAFQNYIQVQREAAAQQAVADYQAWATDQQAKITAQLSTMGAAAQVEYMSVLSTNPPVPPDTLLQTVDVGLSMNGKQIAAYQGIIDAAGAVGDAVQNNQDASASPDLGYIPGAVADIAKIAALNPSNSAKLAALAPDLVENVLPHATSAAEALRLAQKALKLASTSDEVAAATARVAEAEKLVADVAKGLTVAEAIPGVGLVVELVANVVQAGVAIAQYSQIGDFNNAFTGAVNAAQKPVSVADLQQMMSTSAGQQQMFTYLAAMAATDGKVPQVAVPTMSLSYIIAVASGI